MCQLLMLYNSTDTKKGDLTAEIWQIIEIFSSVNIIKAKLYDSLAGNCSYISETIPFPHNLLTKMC